MVKTSRIKIQQKEWARNWGILCLLETARVENNSPEIGFEIFGYLILTNRAISQKFLTYKIKLANHADVLKMSTKFYNYNNNIKSNY